MHPTAALRSAAGTRQLKRGWRKPALLLSLKVCDKHLKVNSISRIKEVADEINRTLNERKKDKYFQSIILMYSFIENLLKWFVFVKIMWMKADKELSRKEMKELEKFCKHLRFYDALEAGLMIDLVDFNLYKRINDVRKERNDVLHQFWIYRHRDNLSVLRKKLEKLARVSNKLVGIFNALTQEIGVEEVYEILLWGDG